MEDQIIIQHRFTKIDENGNRFADAICLPISEYEKLSEKDIEQMKDERFTNWVDAIKNPPQQPEPTKEEQLAVMDKELASIEEQKQLLTYQKGQLQEVK